MSKQVGIITAPMGNVEAIVEDNALVSLEFTKREVLHNNNEILIELENQLKLYFDKKLQKFDIPIRLKGTDFQISVWNELQNIPYGKNLSYLDIAKSINKPKAYRAVGSAIGKNNISIIIPCHRVLRSDKNLGGYRWGAEIKKSLLELELG